MPEGKLTKLILDPERCVVHRLYWFDLGGRHGDCGWASEQGVTVEAEEVLLPYLSLCEECIWPELQAQTKEEPCPKEGRE